MARTSIQTRTHKGAQQGFTLIEMAIAVAIFGLLASGAIMATSAWLGKQALDKTAKNLDRIESALTLYVIQNGALPCPYLGAVNTYSGNCSGATHYVGLLPYRDLGLQRTDVLDGWNRYITYAVDNFWADDQTVSNTPYFNGGSLITLNDMSATGTVSGNAALVVNDASGAGCAAPPATSCAAYVLVSHGEDGNGAYTDFPGARRPNAPAPAAAEIENADDDITFAAEAYDITTGTADTQFDHIVRFRTPAQILRDAY